MVGRLPHHKSNSAWKGVAQNSLSVWKTGETYVARNTDFDNLSKIFCYTSRLEESESVSTTNLPCPLEIAILLSRLAIEHGDFV